MLRRVADSSLQQSASNNRLASAVDKLIPSFEQIRRDLYDIKADRETDAINHQQALTSINEKLARLLDVRDDVKQIAKDVTGAFKLTEDNRTTVERIIDRFESLKTSTKLLIAILFIIAALSGWLTHWFAG